MTNPGDLCSSVTYSDPRRGHVRSLRVSDGLCVTNIESNLVIIECDNYSLYTDAYNVARLITAALLAWSEESYILSVAPPPRSFESRRDLPCSWSLLSRNPGALTLRVPCAQWDRLVLFFDTFARVERWTFALPERTHWRGRGVEECTQVRLEDALMESGLWRFVIAVDLDGMLLGFMQAGSEFDAFNRILAEQHSGGSSTNIE